MAAQSLKNQTMTKEGRIRMLADDGWVVFTFANGGGRLARADNRGRSWMNALFRSASVTVA